MDGSTIANWNWEQFRALPSEAVKCDIHCVTRWSKLDTRWQGVSLDVLLEGSAFDAAYAMSGYRLRIGLFSSTRRASWPDAPTARRSRSVSSTTTLDMFGSTVRESTLSRSTSETWTPNEARPSTSRGRESASGFYVRRTTNRSI